MTHRVRNGEKRHVANCRIFANDQNEVGMIDVRHWMHRPRTKYTFASSELVSTVLRARAEEAFNAHLQH